MTLSNQMQLRLRQYSGNSKKKDGKRVQRKMDRSMHEVERFATDPGTV